MLRNYRWAVRLTLTLVVFLAAHATAYAQASRTWVSGVGDDANPCSRTAPCKTFAGAISKTAAGGEISVLDSAGYGGVTITKSITINAEGLEASVLVAGVNGVNISAGAADRVTLRGLSFTGLGSGVSAIRVLSAAEVVVEDCRIEGFRASTSYGILVAPSSGSTRLSVHNCSINANGFSPGTAAIAIQPTGSATVSADIDDVQLSNNAGGLIVNSVGTSGAVWVSIRGSQIFGNNYAGVLAKSGPTGNLKVLVKDNIITNNGFGSSGAGIQADGAAAVVRMQDNAITVNKTGVLTSNSGQIISYGGNLISGNANNGSFTSTMAPQ